MVCADGSAGNGRLGDVTRLLERARGGDAVAVGELFQALYPELRRIAHIRLRHGFPDPDLHTTVLVHECYLKLCDARRMSATDRTHFLAYVATAMRSIIVDIARAQAAERHGGNAPHVALDDMQVGGDPRAELEILQVHEALEQIGAFDARLVQVVELRYFVGLTDEEIATMLGVTDRTVRRDWQKARLLLSAALR